MSSSFQILPAIFVLIAEYKIASSFNYFLSQVFFVFFPNIMLQGIRSTILKAISPLKIGRAYYCYY
jgi:hypothetical protein